jgi:hypothetical protein
MISKSEESLLDRSMLGRSRQDMPKVAIYTYALLVKPRPHPENRSFFELDREVLAAVDGAPGFLRLVLDYPEPMPHPNFVDLEADYPTFALSVWADLRSVFQFSYRQADHTRALQRRREWFPKPIHPNYVLWWTEDPATVTFHEAVARMNHLALHGPTPRAFDFRHLVDSAGAPLPDSLLR